MSKLGKSYVNTNTLYQQSDTQRQATLDGVEFLNTVFSETRQNFLAYFLLRHVGQPIYKGGCHKRPLWGRGS